MFQNHVVGLNFRKQLVCVDLATGKTKWTTGVSGNYASIVRAGGQLLVLADDGQLFVYEANPESVVRKAQWTLTENGPTWSHLAVSNGRLYVKDRHEVLCFDLSQR
jgi:outer membrane protein assembly factor BamB